MIFFPSSSLPTNQMSLEAQIRSINSLKHEVAELRAKLCTLTYIVNMQYDN